MFQPPKHIIDARLRDVLTSAASASASTLTNNKQQQQQQPPPLHIQELIQLSTNGTPATPWYNTYKEEFYRLLQFNDHETMDYPIAWLLVLNSDIEGDPAAAFTKLFSSAKLPPLMKKGLMEMRIPKHYILLHDAGGNGNGDCSDDSAAVEEKLRRISAVFGSSSSHLLTINSNIKKDTNDDTRGDGGVSTVDPGLWLSLLPDAYLPGGGAGEADSLPPVVADDDADGNNNNSSSGGRRKSKPADDDSKKIGASLTMEDTSRLAFFVSELAVKGLIPSLEMRVRSLNHQVSVTRKGLKNQLKNLLFRKATAVMPIEPSSQNGGGETGQNGTTSNINIAGNDIVLFPASSVEGQMRQLSDLAMTLGDYETAISTLRLLATDYKAEKAYKHYAAVQEALGIATFLSGGRTVDAVAHLKEALYRYQAARLQPYPASSGPSTTTSTSGAITGTSSNGTTTTTSSSNNNIDTAALADEATRLASRAAMRAMSILNWMHLTSEAHLVCMKAHIIESDERAGLLLEQAAHSLLAMKPPQVRKFAFHLVLAALRFNMCNQGGLALDAYKQAMAIYSNSGGDSSASSDIGGRAEWSLISEHMNEALGKAAMALGDEMAAVNHFAATLACPKNSVGCQEAHMAEFMRAVHAAKEKRSGEIEDDSPMPMVVDNLPVPIVDVEKVGLSFAGQTAFGNLDARSLPDADWKVVEAGLLPAGGGEGGTTASTNWLENGTANNNSSSSTNLAAAAQDSKNTAKRVCCVGEVIGLDIELHNPLKLELPISRLRLMCLFEEEQGVDNEQQQQQTTTTTTTTTTSTSTTTSSSSLDSFEVKEEKITLRPEEKVTMHLRVVPSRPGTLLIQGVAWILGGPNGLQVETQRALLIPSPPSPPSMKSKQQQQQERPPPGGVSFTVLPPAPKLEVVDFQGLPPTVLVGQMVPCQVTLRNSGSVALENLMMTTSLDGSFQLIDDEEESATTTTTTNYDDDGTELSSLQQLSLNDNNNNNDNNKNNNKSVIQLRRKRGSYIFTPLPQSKSKGQAKSTTTTLLLPGQEVCFPVIIRPHTPGPQRFIAAWYYEPSTQLDGLPYRTVRTSYTSVVLPSIECHAAVVPSAQQAGDYLLQLSLLNLQGLQSFRLKQVSCITSSSGEYDGTSSSSSSTDGDATSWSLRPLKSTSNANSSAQVTWPLDLTLQPESATNIHFQLVDTSSSSGSGSGSGSAGKSVLSSTEEFVYRALHAPPPPPTGSSSSQQHTGQHLGSNTDNNTKAMSKLSHHMVSPLVNIAIHWEAIVNYNNNNSGDAPPSDQQQQEQPGIHFMSAQRASPHGLPLVHSLLKGPDMVPHDFTLNPHCIVHLKLVLVNTLPADAAVCIEVGNGSSHNTNNGVDIVTTTSYGSNGSLMLGGTAGAAGGAVPSPQGTIITPPSASTPPEGDSIIQPVNDYVWCCRTRVTLNKIPYKQSVEVPLCIAVTRGGMIELKNCVVVSWSYADAPELSGSVFGPPKYIKVGM
jgi:hypothetical protein